MLSFIAPFYKQEWSGFNSAVTWNMTSGVRTHTEVLDKYCLLCLPPSFSPFTTILLSTYLSKPHKHTQKDIWCLYIWRQITLSISFLFICLKYTRTHILNRFYPFFLSLSIDLSKTQTHTHISKYSVHTWRQKYIYHVHTDYCIIIRITREREKERIFYYCDYCIIIRINREREREKGYCI